MPRPQSSKPLCCSMTPQPCSWSAECEHPQRAAGFCGVAPRDARLGWPAAAPCCSGELRRRTCSAGRLPWPIFLQSRIKHLALSVGQHEVALLNARGEKSLARLYHILMRKQTNLPISYNIAPRVRRRFWRSASILRTRARLLDALQWGLLAN